ncbi:unnamed protein product [Moneuplotes crassus]|uniref:Uncharacterized protein n=1 Tax=Euplotes crassus TaxID=5936 RepID=A0AAD1U7J3_EUPCR|nr:unnamed protein product [Moneuplotes crassus]
MLNDDKNLLIRKSFIRSKKKMMSIPPKIKPRPKISHIGNYSQVLISDKQKSHFSPTAKPKPCKDNFPIIKLSTPDITESLIDLHSPQKEKDSRNIKRMKRFGEAFNKVKCFRPHMEFASESEDSFSHQNPGNKATKNWKLISDVVLKTNKAQFLNWMEEINPEAYEQLINTNKSVENVTTTSKKRSEISQDNEKEPEEEKQKVKKNVTKKFSKYKNILHKALAKMVFKYYSEIAKNIETQKKKRRSLPKPRKKDSKTTLKKSRKASVHKSQFLRNRNSTNIGKNKIDPIHNSKSIPKKKALTRFNSEMKKFLKVPTKDSFDTSEKDSKIQESLERGSRYSSISNQSFIERTNEKRSHSSFLRSPIPCFPKKIKIMNIKPVKLSQSRLRNLYNFENEKELPLDNCKKELLLRHIQKGNIFKKRRRGRNFRNLIKSFDQIKPEFENSVIGEIAQSRFSRKSTGVSRSSLKKKQLSRFLSGPKELENREDDFLSHKGIPPSTQNWKILPKLSKQKLKHMKKKFKEIMNYKGTPELPIACSPQIPNIITP